MIVRAAGGRPHAALRDRGSDGQAWAPALQGGRMTALRDLSPPPVLQFCLLASGSMAKTGAIAAASSVEQRSERCDQTKGGARWLARRRLIQLGSGLRFQLGQHCVLEAPGPPDVCHRPLCGEKLASLTGQGAA